MAKSDKPPIEGWGEKRAVFVALLDQIRRDVVAGRSLRAAYVSSGANEGMGYSIFTRYVARYLPEESKVQRWGERKANAVASPAAIPPLSSPTTQATASAPPTPTAPSEPEQSIRTPQVNPDGPKAAPRPRSFTRLGGIADDHKDKLI